MVLGLALGDRVGGGERGGLSKQLKGQDELRISKSCDGRIVEVGVVVVVVVVVLVCMVGVVMHVAGCGGGCGGWGGQKAKAAKARLPGTS